MTDPCENHAMEAAVRCYHCRTDAMVNGDTEAFLAWHRRFQDAECDEQFPVRYRPAVADHSDVLAWVETWRSNPATCSSLLLTGNVGTGKTWQGYGAVRAAVTAVPMRHRGEPGSWRAWQITKWIATTSADMYAALRPQPKRDTEAELARYRETELLFIDDLGAAKTSEWVEEVTYRIIGGRYDAMLPTIYTSNLPTAELRDVLGNRITSRLAETTTRVKLTGEDRRRVKAA